MSTTLNNVKKNREKVSNKFVLFSTIIFVVAIVSINVYSSKLDAVVLDFRIGYSTEIVYTFFKEIGSTGRSLYNNMLIIDFIFPVIYMVFAISLFSYVLNKYKYSDGLINIAIIFPVIAMICDWVENILILRMLNNYGNTKIDRGYFASSMTTSKFIFLGTFLIVLFTFVLYNKFIKKIKIKEEYRIWKEKI